MARTSENPVPAGTSFGRSVNPYYDWDSWEPDDEKALVIEFDKDDYEEFAAEFPAIRAKIANREDTPYTEPSQVGDQDVLYELFQRHLQRITDQATSAWGKGRVTVRSQSPKTGSIYGAVRLWRRTTTQERTPRNGKGGKASTGKSGKSG